LTVLPVFVLGVVCAIAFDRSRWLAPAIAARVVYNAAIFTANRLLQKSSGGCRRWQAPL